MSSLGKKGSSCYNKTVNFLIVIIGYFQPFLIDIFVEALLRLLANAMKGSIR
ncbi:hypothetical protein RR47_GL000456 [Enterococcus columbae DSM 7374 = ATCC 51263]|nr:hypothetical protein RR47_GL000456 [Enterococcus columbae DSM 7374 = ATCC 51263]